MKCPACGKGTTVVKCDKCGDVRCSLGGCPGTMGGPKTHGHPNSTCHACKKGKYIKI